MSVFNSFDDMAKGYTVNGEPNSGNPSVMAAFGKFGDTDGAVK